MKRWIHVSRLFSDVSSFCSDWALIIHTSVRRWLTVYPIRPERCGQHPVTWARLAAYLLAGCFFPVSFQHVVVFMCQRVFVLNVWRSAAVMSRCSISAVFCDMRYAIACARVRMYSSCPAFTFFCFSFFPSFTSSIVNTAWAHFVSLTYVPSVPAACKSSTSGNN